MPTTSNIWSHVGLRCFALLAVGGLRLSLESLSAGPDSLLIVVVGVLLIPTASPRSAVKVT